ncbi:nucleotidyltransferase family protein [Aquibacillus sp. 3ASR75-11]|uniref:Nucleotidyltransferase family protein n=1 Tax=Terrihalobacillus insolitus TaxID=2950438 RepID=A0A9X3WRM9_9BACI|nr:nucleotidyltransferase family protein [Terrihalobacillus insolitus]MDC3424505.1 nucleotidyltransferase family protein [Terrihalobacillus insolitus]
MVIRNEEDIIKAIREDEWMMNLLKTVKVLNLPDWWICAGFVRSKIWDVVHNFSSRTPLPDIDVIYFDSRKVDELEEKKIEEMLKSFVSDIPWSVKNQARMHIKSNMPPYSSSIDGISKFPETATSLGVKLDEKNDIKLIAPWGINDVVNLEVRPTPFYDKKERIKVYNSRVTKKGWDKIWNRVKVYGINNS